MKKLSLQFIFVSLYITAFTQPCETPVQRQFFDQNYKQLAAIKNIELRFTNANEFVNNNCVLTYMVKQMAELFPDDYKRLEFAKNAWVNTVDQENYFDIYDVFSKFSSAMRLHDYIDELENDNAMADNAYDYEPNFPAYYYPSYKNYKASSPCREPLSESEFHNTIRMVRKQKSDADRLTFSIAIAKTNCLTVEQIMKIGSLIQNESIRLEFLKQSYLYSYDTDNYHYTDQLFSDDNYCSDYSDFLISHRPANTNTVNSDRHLRCYVDEIEMPQILESINKQSFENDKMNLAKQIVQSKECFLTLQIMQIVKLFDFEDSKLEVAKFCYAYCIDQENYYKINDAFNFSGTSTKLTEYIQANRSNRKTY